MVSRHASAPKFTAILLAAGQGRRLGGVKKHFLRYAGKTLLEREVTRVAPVAGQILVAIARSDWSFAKTLRFNVPVQFIVGGANRLESIRNCLKHTTGEYVLVCDACRPYVTHDLVSRLARRLHTCDAAAPAISFRLRESIAIARKGRFEEILPRSGLLLTQTPQGFRTRVLVRCVTAARRQRWRDVSLVGIARRLGIVVAVVAGDPRNKKITFPEDLSDEFEIRTTTLARRTRSVSTE